MNRSLRKPKYLFAYIALAGVLLLVAIFGQGYIIQAWNKATSYHVNPAIFLALLLVTIPPFYWSWYSLLKLAAQKKWAEFVPALIINRLIWAPPWVYVFIFGDSYPWWVRPALVLYGLVAIAMVTMKAIHNKSIQPKELTA